MATTLRVIYSDVLGRDAVMYELANEGKRVEYGDFEAAYLDEIIDGRDVNVIVVRVMDYAIWDAVRAYCAANGIEYRNLTG